LLDLSIPCGTLTPVGTSTNRLVDEVAHGDGQPGFGISNITAVGPVAAGAASLLFMGWQLLPYPAVRVTRGERR